MPNYKNAEMLLVIIIQTAVLLTVAQHNLTPNGTASQSSSYQKPNGSAEYAIYPPASNKFTFRTCSQTVVMNTNSQAWWMFQFSFGFAHITDITIYYREGFAKRMDGFRLYVTNTSTIPPQGHLCYADSDPGFPDITQTIPCNQLGKYVIYYDEKGSDEGNHVPGPIVELCYVAINGCQMSYLGSHCDEVCPENCIGQHCYIGNGTCVWGCNAENCLGNNCNSETSVCIDGCKNRRTGHYCNKYNMASDSLVSQYPNGSELANKATDGYKISCSRTQGHNVKFQVDLIKESIVTGIYITLGELTTHDGMHSVYASNTSTWTNGIELYNEQNLPKEIHCNEVFRYLTYLPKIQGSSFDLEVCEIGIIGCPPTHYGPVCDQRCPENCHGPCDLKTGLCIFGCLNGWKGDECKQTCSSGTYGKDCFQACSTHCLNPTCNRMNGECIGECNDGWKGLDCTIKCPNGSFGRNCLRFCDGCISTLCDNVNGLCDNKTSCKPGYEIGEYCNTSCDDWYFGNNCTRQCHCLEKPCDNDNGICSPEGCKEGWRGQSCDQACNDWYFGYNCAWKCYCLTGPCNMLTGECPPGGCQKGWHGVACEVTEENRALLPIQIGLFLGGFLLGIMMTAAACFLARKRQKLRKNQGKDNITEKTFSNEQQHYDDVRMENVSTYQDLMTRQTIHDYEHINTAFVRQ